MYTDWFKLNRLPFRLRPDPDFLHLAGETAHVYEALRAAVGSGQGIITLVGEPGVGKTTLLHAIAQERQGSMTVARVQQPNLTSQELLEALLEQFGLAAPGSPGAGSPARLTRFIAEETGHGRPVLILVDEAHRCAASTLKELLNLGARLPAPLVVLAGEPELLTQLAALEGQGVAVRLVGSLRLPRLTPKGTEGYLAYRLQVAGGSGRVLFDAEALTEIQRYTGGTPQLINVLCDNAMGLAEAHSNQRVTANDIRDAVQELKWVEFSARPVIRAAAPAFAGGAAPEAATAIKAHDLVPQLDVEQRGRPLTRLTLKPGRLVVGRAEDAGLRLDKPVRQPPALPIITTSNSPSSRTWAAPMASS